MFITKKKHEKIVSELRSIIKSLSEDSEEREFFYKKGVKAAQMAVNGYVMVDKKYLPNGKNCPVFMGHGLQKAADMLKVASKKWERLYSHEQRNTLKKVRDKTLAPKMEGKE